MFLLHINILSLDENIGFLFLALLIIFTLISFFAILYTSKLKGKINSLQTDVEKYKELLLYAKENNTRMTDDAELAKAKNKEFLVKMNYEFRTAINAIQGTANMLCETPLTKKQNEYVIIIEDYTKRCISFLENFFSGNENKIEQKPIELKIDDPKYDKIITGSKEEKTPALFADEYPLKILVAEDDQINRIIAVKLFEKLGYKPDVVENGKEALDIVSERDYNIIFMDVRMPVMDGREATKMIRLCLEKQPVIIALTANVLDEEKEKCIMDGMNDFLAKPLYITDVTRLIEKWAGKKKETKPELN